MRRLLSPPEWARSRFSIPCRLFWRRTARTTASCAARPAAGPWSFGLPAPTALLVFINEAVAPDAYSVAPVDDAWATLRLAFSAIGDAAPATGAMRADHVERLPRPDDHKTTPNSTREVGSPASRIP